MFHLDGVATIGSAFGGIPRGLPSLHMPEITVERVIELIGRRSPSPCSARSSRCCRPSSPTAWRHAPRLESGTDRSGHRQHRGAVVRRLRRDRRASREPRPTCATAARSPIAGIVHALTLVLIVLVAGAARGAHSAGGARGHSVRRGVEHERGAALRQDGPRAPPADVVILLVTFALTVFVDLVVAVNIGVILATLHFLRRMASSVEVQQQTAAGLESRSSRIVA